MIDHTHDPAARSWVQSATGHDHFPIQNLPLGSFSTDGIDFRCGVAIGDSILDLRAVASSGLLPVILGEALKASDLGSLLKLGRPAMTNLRHALFALLGEDSPVQGELAAMLHDAADCTMALPTRPGGYTDFYAGIVHATNVGSLLRPENPLMPNYKWIPIGYHGRTSSVRPSGTSVRRPRGQIKSPEAESPQLQCTDRLDYEVELGLWITGGNALGEPVPIGEAEQYLAGVTLLNDWSARDIQAWEYQPLGPFLAKNFASTVSPWLVTLDALAPFRDAQLPRLDGDPQPLPHLLDAGDQASGGLDIDLTVAMTSEAMRRSGRDVQRLGLTSARHMYWTPAQLIAHHSSNGCNLEPGDLLGTGTISAPTVDGYGSLMEITRGGKDAFALPNGETRRFLQDGDEVILTGHCRKTNYATIGFGECRAMVLPAL